MALNRRPEELGSQSPQSPQKKKFPKLRMPKAVQAAALAALGAFGCDDQVNNTNSAPNVATQSYNLNAAGAPEVFQRQGLPETLDENLVTINGERYLIATVADDDGDERGDVGVTRIFKETADGFQAVPLMGVDQLPEVARVSTNNHIATDANGNLHWLFQAGGRSLLKVPVVQNADNFTINGDWALISPDGIEGHTMAPGNMQTVDFNGQQTIVVRDLRDLYTIDLENNAAVPFAELTDAQRIHVSRHGLPDITGNIAIGLAPENPAQNNTTAFQILQVGDKTLAEVMTSFGPDANVAGVENILDDQGRALFGSRPQFFDGDTILYTDSNTGVLKELDFEEEVVQPEDMGVVDPDSGVDAEVPDMEVDPDATPDMEVDPDATPDMEVDPDATPDMEVDPDATPDAELDPDQGPDAARPDSGPVEELFAPDCVAMVNDLDTLPADVDIINTSIEGGKVCITRAGIYRFQITPEEVNQQGLAVEYPNGSNFRLTFDIQQPVQCVIDLQNPSQGPLCHLHDAQNVELVEHNVNVLTARALDGLPEGASIATGQVFSTRAEQLADGKLRITGVEGAPIDGDGFIQLIIDENTDNPIDLQLEFRDGAMMAEFDLPTIIERARKAYSDIPDIPDIPETEEPALTIGGASFRDCSSAPGGNPNPWSLLLIIAPGVVGRIRRRPKAQK